MPVDQYIGGIEHAVMHLIYARFMTKFLYDLGLVDGEGALQAPDEPGVIKKDGKMMSKSLGNVVAPGEVMDKYGADALRVFILFIGPPEDDYDWPDEGADAVIGAYRFLERVWRLVTDNADALRGAGAPSGASETRKTIHRALGAIGERFERFAFNTAISEMMTLQRMLASGAKQLPAGRAARGRRTSCCTRWPPSRRTSPRSCGSGSGGRDRSTTAAGRSPTRRWPCVESVTMIVQVDSKVRDKIDVPADISEDDASAAAWRPTRSGRARRAEPSRVIARPPRLVNILTR